MIALRALGMAAVLFTVATSAEQLSDAEKEAFLKTAKLVRHERLTTGITGARRVTLTDGSVVHDAQVQSVDVTKNEHRSNGVSELHFRDSYKYNVAAYRLARLLGIETVPVSVERRDIVFGTSAATWWIDGVLMDESERLKRQIPPPDSMDWHRRMHVVTVFDELIYNTDRNLGNLLIGKDWKIWMIDHTRAFRRFEQLRSPGRLNSCERALYEALKKLDEGSLNRELRPYLNGTEIRALLARRDRIVEIIESRRRAYGDDAVLFDLASR